MMDIIIVCDGGCGRTTEGMTLETRSGEFEQIDESGVPKWTCPVCHDTGKPQQPEKDMCPGCDGEGNYNDEKDCGERCPKCKGRGKAQQPEQEEKFLKALDQIIGFGGRSDKTKKALVNWFSEYSKPQQADQDICPECRGAGDMRSTRADGHTFSCPKCHGTGRVPKADPKLRERARPDFDRDALKAILRKAMLKDVTPDEHYINLRADQILALPPDEAEIRKQEADRIIKQISEWLRCPHCGSVSIDYDGAYLDCDRCVKRQSLKEGE